MSDVTEAFTAEVVRLHDFFVAWFGSSASCDFGDFDAAMDVGFHLVTPDGSLRTKAEVTELIRAAADSGPVDIWIESPAVHSIVGDVVVGTYEEHHRRGDVRTARQSTAVLRRDRAAPAGWTWLAVHETWIDPPQDDASPQASTPASR